LNTKTGFKDSRIQPVGFADLKGGFHSEAGPLDPLGPLGPFGFAELLKRLPLGSRTTELPKRLPLIGADSSSYRKRSLAGNREF
jgi:hypothetical protein